MTHYEWISKTRKTVGMQGLEDDHEDENVDEVEASSANLLDRLLYKGVLPRYAFPTDVASFYVFDQGKYKDFKPAFKFSPSQGLSVALSQYAPGKEVWISGKAISIRRDLLALPYGTLRGLEESPDLLRMRAMRVCEKVPFVRG